MRVCVGWYAGVGVVRVVGGVFVQVCMSVLRLLHQVSLAYFFFVFCECPIMLIEAHSAFGQDTRPFLVAPQRCEQLLGRKSKACGDVCGWSLAASKWAYEELH
ncbi:unnamed protein product [Gongylonema pulchrum]|uniref:Secreted protein n=1 Tax=Gongylonema pulchrum TaxID=637853 RepID=A0A183E1M5_9BILA|nr:unnamed protein product [Gongylonema pulchrum]